MIIKVVGHLFLSILAFFGFSSHADFNAIIGRNVVLEKPSSKVLPYLKDSADNFSAQAAGVALLDVANNNFIYEQNSADVKRIASITKLMTAQVFLECNPQWDEYYQIQKSDMDAYGGKVRFAIGEKIKVRDIFNSMLIASDNNAAFALSHICGADFVDRMNAKAKMLGLENTNFSDPAGLGNDNYSTAREVASLAKAAFAKSEIRDALSTKSTSFTDKSGKRKKNVSATNELLQYDFSKQNFKLIIGKTGYTELAGYCLASEFESGNGKQIISVILGSENEQARFQQTLKMVEWFEKNYNWH